METLTLEELFLRCLNNEDVSSDSEPAGRTAACPTYRKFESHVRGTSFLLAEDMRHVNRCPDYCQLVLRNFRNQLQRAAPQFSIATLPLAAHSGAGSNKVYEAPVETNQGQFLSRAKILLTGGPFLTPGGYLVLRLSVSEPRFDSELLPLQLWMTDIASATPIEFAFDLPSQSEELVKVRVPTEKLSDPQWKEIENCGELPFSFVVRLLGRPELSGMA